MRDRAESKYVLLRVDSRGERHGEWIAGRWSEIERHILQTALSHLKCNLLRCTKPVTWTKKGIIINMAFLVIAKNILSVLCMCLYIYEILLFPNFRHNLTHLTQSGAWRSRVKVWKDSWWQREELHTAEVRPQYNRPCDQCSSYHLQSRPSAGALRTRSLFHSNC